MSDNKYRLLGPDEAPLRGDECARVIDIEAHREQWEVLTESLEKPNPLFAYRRKIEEPCDAISLLEQILRNILYTSPKSSFPDGGMTWSAGNSTYANALRLLAHEGKFVITEDRTSNNFEVVTGYWPENKPT